MSKINKILVAAFVVIFVFVIGEVIYYLFFLAPESRLAQTNIPNTTNNTTTQQPQQIQNSPDQAISEQTLSNLRALKKGVYNEVSVNVVTNAEITELVRERGPIEGTNREYIVILGVRHNNNPAANQRLHLEESDLTNIVTKGVDGKTKKLSIDDLKVGDKIVLEIKHDLLTDPHTTSITKITKM